MTGRVRVLAAAFAAVPGSSPHSGALLSMIDALRAELDLVTVKTEELAHTKRIGDARMVRVPMGTAGTAHQRELYTRAVGRQIEAEPYQVVHVLDPWAGVAAADRRRGFSLVYEVTTFPDAEGEDYELWAEAHEHTVASADRVVVPTVAAARALEARGIASVEVVRPGVDIGALDWAEVPHTATPRVLYLGPFTPSRDLDTVITAMARVAALRPVRVLMAGEPDHERRRMLRERVRAAGAEDVIEVRGEPGDARLAGLIAAADVCLAPGGMLSAAGLSELPHPLLEYAACYRPIVAAVVPGLSELLRDDVEALLYPPGDPSALADAVLEVLRDSVLRDRLMDAGYRRVRDELGSGARRRRVRALYESLATGTQLVDPWRDNFEEVTGLIELSTSALERLSDEGSAPAARRREAATDTAETLALAPDETIRPRVSRTESARDTQPGLVVPDTDPGRQ